METSLEFSMSQGQIDFPSVQTNTPSRLVIGERVDALHRHTGKYFQAKIAAHNADGTYDVVYEDGEKESEVPTKLVQSIESALTSKLVMGHRVEARYKGKLNRYPGVVAKCNPDGTFDIDYDDGEKESNVQRHMIKSLENTEPLANVEKRQQEIDSVRFNVGDKVEARSQDHSRYKVGIVSSVLPDDTYDIKYDDGETLSNVRPEWVRARSAAKVPPSASKEFSIGQRVDARFSGNPTYYSGVIAATNADGTYDIDCDDGTQVKTVSNELIRAESSLASPQKVKFTVGAHIDARYLGQLTYYGGVISALNSDGTYCVVYDNGKQEKSVREELIRPKDIDAPSNDATIHTSSCATSQSCSALIEANTTSSSNADCVGNKKDSTVPLESGQESSDKLAIGSKPEARNPGPTKYEASIVSAVNKDDTQAIQHDAGERAKDVPKKLTRTYSSRSDHLSPLDDSLEVTSTANNRSQPPLNESAAEESKGSDLDQSQQSTSKLLAAANAIRKSDKAAGKSATINLVAAAQELESSASQLAASGLSDAAQFVQRTEAAAAQARLAETAAEDGSVIQRALKQAAEDDAHLDDAAKTLVDNSDVIERRSRSQSPRPHPGSVGTPWVEGKLNSTAQLAARSLRTQRSQRDRPAVSKMKRTLLARSVNFGKQCESRRPRGTSNVFTRLTSTQRQRPTERHNRGTQRFKDRLHMYGTYDDATHCVFKPRVQGNSFSNIQRDSHDEDAKEDSNFVQRQEAWYRKVCAEKNFRIGKRDYELRQDKKVCPKCGATQAYDEYEQNRNRCVECGINYVKPNRGNISKFLSRLGQYEQDSEARLKELEKELQSNTTKAGKLAYQNARILKVPLFSRRDKYEFETFLDRVAADEARRRVSDIYSDHCETGHSPDCKWKGVNTEAFEEFNKCTFEPHSFTAQYYK